MLKRIAIFCSAATLMFSTCTYAKTAEFIINDSTYSMIDNYNKETNSLLAAPFIQNDRTMIPVRAVSESFGSSVVWDSETRSVTISKDEKTVQFVIDSLNANVNGVQTTLDAAPCIVNDTTFVPLRFVTEALGFHVHFVSRTGSILVCDIDDLMTINGKAVTYPEFEALRYLLASRELTGTALNNYTKSYLLKNTVLLNAAEKASVQLTEQQNENIDSALGRYQEDLPFTKGAFALLMENEEKGLEYLNTIYNPTEIQNYYMNNYVCAKHVLVSGNTEENEALAETIYEQAAAGVDFDKLIDEFGQDPGTSDNPDGYVFTQGDMVDSFETTAYALEIGEISRPVQSPYGYHIIKRLALPTLSEEKENEIIFHLYVAPLINDSVIE